MQIAPFGNPSNNLSQMPPSQPAVPAGSADARVGSFSVLRTPVIAPPHSFPTPTRRKNVEKTGVPDVSVEPPRSPITGVFAS